MARRDPKLIAKQLAARAEKLLGDLRPHGDAQEPAPTPRPRTVANESGRTITISTPAAKPPTPSDPADVADPEAGEGDEPAVDAGSGTGATEATDTDPAPDIAEADPEDAVDDPAPDAAATGEALQAPTDEQPTGNEHDEAVAAAVVAAPDDAPGATDTAADAPEAADTAADAPEASDTAADAPQASDTAADAPQASEAGDDVAIDESVEDEGDEAGAGVVAAAGATAGAALPASPAEQEGNPAATGTPPAETGIAPIRDVPLEVAESDEDRRRRLGLLAVVLLLLIAAIGAIVLSTTGDDDTIEAEAAPDITEDEATTEGVDQGATGSDDTSATDAPEASGDGDGTTEADTDSTTEPDTGSTTEAGTDDQTGAAPDTEPDTDSATEPDTGSTTEAGTDNETGTDPDTEAGTDNETGADPDTEPEAQADADAQADTDAEGGTDEAPLGTEVAESRAIVQGGKIVLEGAVPSQEAADAIVSLASDILGADNVVNNYVIDPRADDPNLGNVRVDDSVLFEPGVSVVAPDFEPLLGQALALMSVRPSVTMTIVGHTDSLGDDQANLLLSLQRAQAVERWLTDRGVDAERLTAVGRGETEPIASNDTDEGRQLNRRIQVFIENLLVDG